MFYGFSLNSSKKTISGRKIFLPDTILFSSRFSGILQQALPIHYPQPPAILPGEGSRLLQLCNEPADVAGRHAQILRKFFALAADHPVFVAVLQDSLGKERSGIILEYLGIVIRSIIEFFN